MMVPWLLMSFALLLLLWAHAKERPALEWVVKPLAALLFVVSGYRYGALTSLPGTVLFAGLCLAAVGDVLLIPKSKRSFLAGLVAFLLGHVAYAVAFALWGLDAIATAVAFGLLIGAAWLVLRWLWPHVEGPMRAPVLAYVVVITSMVALAVGAAVARKNPWMLVGALGFYLSDLSVARGRFIGQSLANRAWGLPLYFYSQLLLASVAATPV